KLQIAHSHRAALDHVQAGFIENGNHDGCDAPNDGRDPNETSHDFRAWEEFFRRNDEGDTHDHERVHHSEHDQNHCRAGAADATGLALLAAEPEIGFTFRANTGAAEWRTAVEQGG